ncbi:MAG: ABC transporter ATP-binding protein [Vicinamibacterales bacterium]
MSAHAIMAFSGVGKSFATKTGEIVATRDITVAIDEGEIIAIVGPSGCGKTTLLNLVAGLMLPSTGTVFYRGERVDAINGRTGYMTQSDHLLPWRDVASNIGVPMEIRGVPAAERSRRVAELVELVGLSGFERSYPAALSGGMRKRTALARLLAYDPETLLLDEPFAALDAQLRLRMQTELVGLSRRLNKTVLFVTHDLDEAVAVGDRCLVFSARPGTILHDVPIPLPRDRDMLALRSDADYRLLCGRLWEHLAPALGAADGAGRRPKRP